MGRGYSPTLVNKTHNSVCERRNAAEHGVRGVRWTHARATCRRTRRGDPGSESWNGTHNSAEKHITGSNKSRCSGVNHGSHERYLQSSMLWQTAQSVCLDFQDPHEVDDRTARKPWLLRRSEWSMHMEEQAS